MSHYTYKYSLIIKILSLIHQQVKGAQEVKRPGLHNPKTPAALTNTKKRCREGEDTASTKKMKPGVSLFKSPSKSTLRSPTKVVNIRPGKSMNL